MSTHMLILPQAQLLTQVKQLTAMFQPRRIRVYQVQSYAKHTCVGLPTVHPKTRIRVLAYFATCKSKLFCITLC
jgi:hypothetical protein